MTSIGWGWAMSFQPYGDRWRDMRKASHQQLNVEAVKNHREIETKAAREMLRRLFHRPTAFMEGIRQQVLLNWVDILFWITDHVYCYLAWRGGPLCELLMVSISSQKTIPMFSLQRNRCKLYLRQPMRGPISSTAFLFVSFHWKPSDDMFSHRVYCQWSICLSGSLVRTSKQKLGSGDLSLAKCFINHSTT